MSVDSEVLFLTGYTCPGCQAELEPPGRAVDSWLRCPQCGRPSLPPADTVEAGPWTARTPAAVKEARRHLPNLAKMVRFAAPVLLLVAVSVDVTLRVVGADENTRMLADVAAFSCFAVWAIYLLRAMIRP